MRHYLPYNQQLKHRSRELRNHSTVAEILLWQQLRARSMMGYQFYRQKPLANYIVDFYCPAVNLVIEIDGAYHHDPTVVLSDAERENVLAGFGLSFLRFTETEVRKDRDTVIRAIESYIVHFEEQHPECRSRNHRKRKSD